MVSAPRETGGGSVRGPGAAGELVRGLAAGVSLAAVVAGLWLAWWVLVAVLVPGWTPVAITSGSMSPGIRAGDVVVAGAAGPELLTEGAVIVFADDHHGLVTHRIAEVEPDGRLRTKGDANAGVDSDLVHVDDVVGRGRLLIPAVGLPIVWVAHGAWTPLAGLVVVCGALLAYVAAWWRRTAPAPILVRSEPAVAATGPEPASAPVGRRRSRGRSGTAPEPTARERDLIAFAWVER